MKIEKIKQHIVICNGENYSRTKRRLESKIEEENPTCSQNDWHKIVINNKTFSGKLLWFFKMRKREGRKEGKKETQDVTQTYLVWHDLTKRELNKRCWEHTIILVKLPGAGLCETIS